jgi:hypothetical protein
MNMDKMIGGQLKKGLAERWKREKSHRRER